MLAKQVPLRSLLSLCQDVLHMRHLEQCEMGWPLSDVSLGCQEINLERAMYHYSGFCIFDFFARYVAAFPPPGSNGSEPFPSLAHSHALKDRNYT